MKEPPAGYTGPKLVILEQNPKSETMQQIADKVLAETQTLKSVAMFLKDKEDGDLTKTMISSVRSKGAKIVELKEFLDRVNLIKTESEIKNLGLAGKFTEFAFGKIVQEIEEIIEGNKQVKHSAIQKRIEAVLDDTTAMSNFLKNKGMDASFLDFPLPVLVHSGGDFNVQKFQIDSNDNKLQSQAIYINCCGKYCDMSAMASRTLIVNP